MAEARREPGRVPAIILAVLVHLAFIALLVFGVDWQTREPAPVIAELWNNLPGAAPAPPQAKPEPKPEPTPKPAPPEPKPEPKPAQADIELKAKKLKEEKRKLEEETKELEKKKLVEEKQRKELERRKQDREFQELLERQAAQEVQLQQAQREQQDAARRAQAAARGREVDGFKAKIIAKIKPKVNNQPCQQLINPEAEFEVRLMPTGMLLSDPRLKKTSGSPQCDQAIERAIRLAEPLPLPPNPALFDDFRELNLKFRPNE